MNEVYTPIQIARIIGINPMTLKRWEQASVIPQSVRMGRKQTRVWGKAKVILILRFAKELGYPVPSEDEFINGRYSTREVI